MTAHVPEDRADAIARGVTDWLRSVATIDPAACDARVSTTEVPAVDWDAVFRDHHRPLAIGNRLLVAPPVGRAGGAGPRGARDRARHGVRHGPARDDAHVPGGDRGWRSARGGVRTALDVGTGTRRSRRRAGAARRAACRRARRRRGGAAVGAREPGTESAPAGSRCSARRRGAVSRATFDLVVANLLADTLVERGRRPRGARRRPAGRLVVSGVLANQADAVAAAFPPCGWRTRARRRPLAHAPPRARDAAALRARRAGGRPAAFASTGPELRHLRTLRLAPGARLRVLDDAGGEHDVVVEELGARRGDRANRRQQSAASRESPLELVLVPALLKGAKMDLVVEKATELGVHAHRARDHGSRRGAKARTWSAGGASRVAAAKQSGRTRVPTVDAPGAARRPWRGRPGPGSASAVGGGVAAAARTICRSAPQRCVVLVGPEGGFAADEVTLRGAPGFVPITLGRASCAPRPPPSSWRRSASSAGATGARRTVRHGWSGRRLG